MNAARKIGYDYALNFINGQTDALDDSKSKARQALLRFTKDLDIRKFVDESHLIGERDYSGKIPVSSTFNQAALKSYSEKISNILLSAYDDAEKAIAAINANTQTSQKQKLASIFNAQIQSFQDAKTAIEKEFENDTILMNYSLEMLKTSMQDEAILDMLIKKDKIRMDVIVEMSMNMSVQEIEDVFDKVKKNIKDFGGDTFRQFLLIEEGISDNYLSDEQFAQRFNKFDEDYQNYLKEYEGQLYNIILPGIQNAFGLMYNNTAAGITAGVKTMYETLEATGDFTEKEIKKMIDDVISTIDIVSPEILAGTIKEQAKLLQNVFKLGEDIEKGDLSKFTEMVGEFGYQQVMGILQGSDAAMKQFLNDQKTETMANINESIAALEAYYKVQDANMTREQVVAAMTDSEREQYLLLTLIRDTYEQIVDLEQMREFRLKNVKELQKEISDILKLQESLSALDVQDTAFVALLDSIIQIKREAATTSLTTQLGEDIENLKEFIDGTTFAFDPDSDLDAASAAIEGTIKTLTELISLQTEAYKQQEKIIKDRYKTESDAIKKAYDERWQEIEYTNEIAEAEENLVIARRQLEALTISNASRGQLEEAQKNLEKLRQERDKIIEERMLKEAQKQLEIDMQEDLANELVGLNDSIEHYTELLATLINRIVALNPIWTPPPPSIVPPPPGSTTPGLTNTLPDEPVVPDSPNREFVEMMQTTITDFRTIAFAEDSPAVTSTTALTSTNALLKTSIDGLTGTIENWSVQIRKYIDLMTGNEGG
jgi:hypothetical protein